MRQHAVDQTVPLTCLTAGSQSFAQKALRNLALPSIPKPYVIQCECTIARETGRWPFCGQDHLAGVTANPNSIPKTP